MKLLQIDVLNQSQVLAIFLTILLGICSFFLTKFYNMVKQMMEDIKQILISDASTEQRLRQIEKRVEKIESKIGM